MKLNLKLFLISLIYERKLHMIFTFVDDYSPDDGIKIYRNVIMMTIY